MNLPAGPAGGIVAICLVSLATVVLGSYGIRFSRTTSDFLVASRAVAPLWNASAIGGEYLSAASFLGIAGLVMLYGPDMLWYPVGYAAGYLVLLLLVAAPLRRSGAYTLPDFAQSRLANAALRRLASVFVVLICWLYALPQLQGAGLTLRTVTGAPGWLGALLVGALVTGNVAAGGMRSITFVQAFQYWLKLAAISVPAVALVLAWHAQGAPALTRPQLPVFRAATTVTVQVRTDLLVDRPTEVTILGDPARPVLWVPGAYPVHPGERLRFAAGAGVPHPRGLHLSTDRAWALPLTGGRPHPLYAIYSLVLATFLGTMGLPHVLVRFYTNPDGPAARLTTLLVLVLLGCFYLMPAVYGALGRLYAPDLLLSGQTDAVVLVLPARVIGGPAGRLLAALVASGAFAAFLSTTSGLVVSVAGVLVQDVLPRRAGRRVSLRRASLLAGSVPIALSLAVAGLPVSEMVGLAFAVAASTFCPLLVLGIWWRRLTAPGAVAGLLCGGGLAGGAVLLTLAGAGRHGWTAALLAEPAAWSVPAAFAVMVGVSLLTPRSVPPDVARTMVTLHAPEALDLAPPEVPPLPA